MRQDGRLATLLLIAVLAVIVAPAEADDGAVTVTVEALASDLADHEDAEAKDIYKFLHQALFGPGHAVTDRAGAMQYLTSEIGDLGEPFPGERPCEFLGGAPTLVRINLRPFIAGGGDPNDLLDAFATTAGEVHGTPQQMNEAISVVVKWLHSNQQKHIAGELERLGQELASKGYPPVHHSEAYVEAYKPAYRVVDAALAAEHGWCYR